MVDEPEDSFSVDEIRQAFGDDSQFSEGEIDVLIDMMTGEVRLEAILAEVDLDEEGISTIEELILWTTGPLNTDLPAGFQYLSISRLYASIVKEEDELSEIVQRIVEDTKEEKGFEAMSGEKKEQMGKRISYISQRLMTRFRAGRSAEDLLLLLTLVSEEIADHLEVIFKYSTIEEEYRGSTGTDDLIDSLSREQIEELLFRSGILSQDEYSELQHVRDMRNTLVHSVEERLTLDETTKASSEARRAVQALNDITERNLGVRPISV